MPEINETKIYLYHESTFQSFVKDFITFSFLCGSVWFNYIFCGNSYFLNGVLLIMFIIFLFSKDKTEGKFNSKEELITYLQKMDKSKCCNASQNIECRFCGLIHQFQKKKGVFFCSKSGIYFDLSGKEISKGKPQEQNDDRDVGIPTGLEYL